MITALRLLPLVWQVTILGIAITAIVGAYSYWHHTVYQRGYNAAIYAIATKDKEAINAANKISSEVDRCYDSNRSWDAINGVCLP